MIYPDKCSGTHRNYAVHYCVQLPAIGNVHVKFVLKMVFTGLKESFHHVKEKIKLVRS